MPNFNYEELSFIPNHMPMPNFNPAALPFIPEHVQNEEDAQQQENEE